MALKGEDFFDNQYYIYNRRFLTIVGLWPYQESSKRFRYVYFMIGIMTFAITVQAYVLVKSELEMKRITDLMQTYLPTLCFTATYINTLSNLAAIRETLDHIRKDWDKLTNETELMIMHKYASTSRLCCLLIACTFYTYITILICPSVSTFFLYISSIINNSQLLLPIYYEAFVSTDIYYFVIFPLEVLNIVIICTIGIAHCTMLVSFAQHACALFHVVTIKIEQPFNKNICQFYWISADTKFEDEFQWMVEIIQYHGEAINTIDLLLKVLFGRSYVVQLLLALLFIILDFVYFFQIINLMVTTNEAIRNAIYVIGNLFMIYAVFYLGQRLIDHSTNVYTKCCLVPFYELSTKTNKLLLLLTMRCIKPCQIAIGRTIVMSHELFAKLTKISFSFATIFYNTRTTAT